MVTTIILLTVAMSIMISNTFVSTIIILMAAMSIMISTIFTITIIFRIMIILLRAAMSIMISKSRLARAAHDPQMETCQPVSVQFTSCLNPKHC